MTRYYYGAVVFVILIGLFITSFGWCSAQPLDQDILNESKIKKSSFKKVFQEIKKTLPKELNQCSIVVTDIRLLKSEKDSVAENWTVEVCQDKREYFVSTYNPKGYFCTVTPKEKVFSVEKAFWNAAKKDGTEEKERGKFFYIDELEAMGSDGKSDK